MVAYQSSWGPVSDFIQRYLHDYVGNNWGQLKTELTSRFAEISDPQHAFVLLRNIKQKSEENVQLYAERLLSLAEEAFTDQNGRVAAIERQLVGFFADGLVHDYLKMRVMRENPATLQAAVASAITEQNLWKRFNLRIGGVTDSNICHIEPMEIDHLRPTKQCFKCNKLGHCVRECHNRPYAYVEPMEFDHARSPKHCHVCNQLRHLASHCLNRSYINTVASINPDGGVGRKESYSQNGNFPNNRGKRQMRSKTYITC